MPKRDEQQEITDADVGRLDLQSDVDSALKSYMETAAAMGLTLSEEELEQKRQELETIAHGEIAVKESGDYASFEEAIAAAGEDIVIPEDFEKVDNKDELLSIPFFITRFWFTQGDMGDFAVVRGITKGNRRIVLTDGSTGIFAQLKKLALETEKTANVMVRGGLRKSEYTADTDAGPKRATTYYLVFHSS